MPRNLNAELNSVTMPFWEEHEATECRALALGVIGNCNDKTPEDVRTFWRRRVNLQVVCLHEPQTL